MACRLAAYAELLVCANKTMNLTAITEPRDVAHLHLLDSLSAERFIPQRAKILDIGTGGGLPGIPLAIMRPDISVVMIDSTEKKISFVNSAIAELGLKNATANAVRAEELPQIANYDVVLSRAVANLGVLLELGAAQLKVGGLFIAYKGERASDEAKAAQNAAKILGFREPKVIPYQLDGRSYNLILLKKAARTPREYPRRFSQIKAKPL